MHNQKKIQIKQSQCLKQMQQFNIIPVEYNPQQQLTLIIFHNGKSDKNDIQFMQTITKDIVYFIPGRSFCFVQNFKIYENFQQTSEQGRYLQIDKRIVIAFVVPFMDFQTFYTIPKLYTVPNASVTFNIPGLNLIENFLTKEEEDLLIQEIEKGDWIHLARRKVQHFGYDFVYGKNTVFLENPSEKNIPEYCSNILPKIYNEIKKIHSLSEVIFQQLTINDYEPGEGIPPHIDVHSPFKEIFVSLSLSSGCVMTFQNAYDLQNQSHIFFPQRSLMIFSGEARYSWYHSIATRKIDLVDGQGFARLFFKIRDRRISITLRQIQQQPCCCLYKEFCDSQMYDPEKMNIHNNTINKKDKQEHEKINDNNQIINKIINQDKLQIQIDQQKSFL